jgi:hydrogenase/urease accessory protein HupE
VERSAVRTLSYLLATIGLYLLLWQTILTRIDLPEYYYGRLIELLGLGLFIALALRTPMKFDQMGIVTDKRTLLRSLAMGSTVALIAIAFFAAAGWLRSITPLFSWHVTGDISRLTYFLVAPLQEILAKSVMYYGFEIALGRDRPALVIFMCALTFGIFHVAYGIRMMLLAMALSVITGIMFRHVRCVWGCALTHFALGFFPICFGL